jgi:hypothetical protein
VFGLIDHFHHAKSYAIRYEWSEKFVMIASNIDYSGTTLGMTQHSTDHIGMALFPTPSVALHLPTIDDVSHQIQGFTCIMFEEVAECLGLAVSGAEMYI